MTTDRSNAAATPSTPEGDAAGRVLRRRSADRVIGGVASGIGDFLDVDPLLIRIAFAGMMVFGGLGLVLYVGGWLLLPDEATDESIAEAVLRRLGLTPSRLASGLLLLIGGIIFFVAVSSGVPLPEFVFIVAAASIVIVAGVALLRQADHGASRAVARPVADVAPVRPSPTAAASTVAVPRRRREPRPHSPLAWYVLGAMLASVGVLALVVNLGSIQADPGQFFGLALAVLGIGLVIGAWWGHARILIVLGVLLLPVAVMASFVTAPISGGFGYHRYHPANVDEVRDEYRLSGGSLVLDLTDIEGTDDPIVIAASVAMGEVFVALPRDASMQLDASLGAGTMVLLGDWTYGTSLTDRYLRDGAGPSFVLDIEGGIGTVYVENCCDAVNR